MKELINKLFSQIENSRFYYKIFYLFVSLTFVTALDVIPHIGLLSKISLLWGIIIVFYMACDGFKRRKIYNFDLFLEIYLGLTLLLTLLFYRNGSNIKAWIINTVIFISIYTVDIFRNKKELLKEIKIISQFFTGFMMISSVISLFMKAGNVIIKSNMYIFEGSKGGLFQNKNAICIAAAIALALSIYLNYSVKEYKVKCYYIANIVVQVMVILIFRGRSSILIILGMIFTVVFVYNNNKYVRAALLILPVVFTCGLYSKISESILRSFTSGRINLWYSACRVIKNHPFTGVGNSSLVESIQNARITTDLPGLAYGGLHNIYIQIVAVNGFAALILFITFIICMIAFVIKKLDDLKRKEKLRMTILFSIIIGILAVNMFESSLLYIISYISIIFWLYLGYLISILDNRNFS